MRTRSRGKSRIETAVDLSFLADWEQQPTKIFRRSFDPKLGNYWCSSSLMYLEASTPGPLLAAVEGARNAGWRILTMSAMAYGYGGDDTADYQMSYFAYLELVSPPEVVVGV